MSENKEMEVINLREIIQKILKNKKKFIKPLAIVFVLSVVYIYSQPRYYSTNTKLAPEMDNNMSGGALGSLASSFGFDLADNITSDAISPLLYPDLMDDNGFVASLFPIKVETKEGDVKATYYDYLKKHQKKPWWSGFTSWVTGLFKSDDEQGNSKKRIDPYKLSKKDNDIVMSIQGNISFSVDKKTGVITINVKDQDPLICKTMADSVTVLLQKYITKYRTNKARIDVAHYTLLTDSAYKDYIKSMAAYSRFADANQNVILQSYISKRNDLENDIQLKLATYTTLSTQLQAAKAKVQERTPAFTILKGAALPVKPAGPKRMIFIFTMLMLTFFIRAFILVRGDLHLKF